MKRNAPPKIKLLCLLLISLLVAIVSFSKGQEVSFETQWRSYEALRNTSGIVFAVMGAWIAIIYPESLRKIISPDSEGGEEILNMLQAMLISAIILAFVLLLGVAVPLLSQYSFLAAQERAFRGLSYLTLSLMTLAQLWTLLLTILPNYIVKRSMVRRRNDAALLSEMTKHEKRH